MGCWVNDFFKSHPKMDGSKPGSGFKPGFKPGSADPWLAVFLVYHITQSGKARFHLKGNIVSWIPSHYQMILQKTMSLFFWTWYKPSKIYTVLSNFLLLGVIACYNKFRPKKNWGNWANVVLLLITFPFRKSNLPCEFTESMTRTSLSSEASFKKYWNWAPEKQNT